MYQIQFNKLGYEPFFDYIKAYAIICVLIGHTISMVDNWASGLWCSMQVPLFVLLQCFHSLKKTEVRLDWTKLFLRIIVPYLVVQFLLFIYLWATGAFNKMLIISILYGGGYGPGSYFPWIYLQLAIILKFVRPIFKKTSRTTQIVIAVVVCQLIEVICIFFNIPDWLYRLLAVRYIFLIFLAWIWVYDGLRFTKTNLSLSILSAVSIIYFEYFATNTEPLFYNTAWSYHRWPCYFYVSCLMTFIIYRIYLLVRNIYIIDKAVKLLSKCSYEIFLVQMVACVCVPSVLCTSNKYVNFGLRVSVIFIVSIFGGYIFNILYQRFLNRIICIIK